MKMYLILSRSESAAIIMLMQNENAQGGTEYNWVLIGLWPKDWMIAGAKYAYPSEEDQGQRF